MRIDDDTRRRLARARAELEEVPAGPVPVAAIARHARISQFHFIRVFEAAFGATPHQLRIQSRIDRARDMLATSDRSVTEVCVDLGFSSLGSFSAMFARRVGEPPSAYRRRVRVLVAVPGDVRRILAPGCFALMGSLPPGAFRNFREASPPRGV